MVEERRPRRFAELAEQAFPGGRVPGPFTIAELTVSREAVAIELPFIKANRIVVTSLETEPGTPVQAVVFRNVWCLWDTGAAVSSIITNLLNPVVRNNREEGFARMEILCASLSPVSVT